MGTPLVKKNPENKTKIYRNLKQYLINLNYQRRLEISKNQNINFLSFSNNFQTESGSSLAPCARGFLHRIIPPKIEQERAQCKTMTSLINHVTSALTTQVQFTSGYWQIHLEYPDNFYVFMLN